MTPSWPDRRARDLETRWRQVLETADEVYVALDADGVIADWNRAAARLFGVAKDQAVGTRAVRFVPERHRRQFEDGLRTATERPDGGVSAPLELELRNESRGEFVAECVLWGVDRRGGTLVHCFVRDVTERRIAEQASALLAAVVEGSADAIVTEAPDRSILTWNAAAERIYGWTAEEALGASALLYIPEDKVAEHLQLVMDVLNGEPVRGVESERLSLGGVRVPVALRMSPVRDPAGKIVAVSTIARDITEQRWMAETLDSTLGQLYAALAEAQGAEESSRRFLADAAHQLRTPLAGIRACAELLLLGAPEADRDRLLATMVRETSRSARLITGLLRIARLDQGQALPLGQVDLVAVCRDEVERLALLAPELEVTLEVSSTPEASLPLDAGSCQEILTNLGDNARRHATSSIAFYLSAEEGQVLVRVADDGPGVPDEARERVFERFVSLDSRGGSGLGLPIARGLARAMDGELRYADGFVLTLPLAASATSSP